MPTKGILKKHKLSENPSKKAKLNDTARPPKTKGASKPKVGAKISTNAPISASVKKDKLGPVTSMSSPSAKAKGKARAVNDAPEPSLPSSFKIVAGSYEKLLYGLEGTISVENTGLRYNLKPIFIFPAHVSSIKAVAASPGGGKWLATGSADEIIKIWDLRRRKEIGGLMHHEGSITFLEFPSRSHLLSASEDGTLTIFRARDWAVLRSLKGHKGRVNCVAIHPSSKVALSVGKDRTLRMWDLMRGKGSASTKIGKEGELARWSSDGSLFVVQSQSTLDLYSLDMTLLHTITHGSRIQDIKFCKRPEGEGDVLLVAAEDRKVSIYEISQNKDVAPALISEMVGHSNRVKAVDVLQIALPTTPTSSRTSTTIASTISSDGRIHVYDLANLPPSPHKESDGISQFQPIVEYDTKGSRLTCMTLADGDTAPDTAVATGKRKREAEDSESEDESGWLPHADGKEEEERLEEEDEEEEESEAEIEEDSGEDD